MISDTERYRKRTESSVPLYRRVRADDGTGLRAMVERGGDAELEDGTKVQIMKAAAGADVYVWITAPGESARAIYFVSMHDIARVAVEQWEKDGRPHGE